MGADGPLNPKGRSAAEDPSGKAFCSVAAARSLHRRRGKNGAATVSGGAAPPIGLTPKQGMGPSDGSEDRDAEAVDQQAAKQNKGARFKTEIAANSAAETARR